MHDEIIIYYSDNACNPFVRNLIRSIFILDNKKVNFESITEEYKCKEDISITKIIEEVNFAQKIENVIKNKDLINQLKKLIVNNSEIEQCMIEIDKYLYKSQEMNENKFVKLWQKNYGKKKSFQILDNAKINEINRKEADTYLDLFDIQKKNYSKIENATQTLIKTIPCDVDLIADIGSGPGLVNQFIPYYYDILAVDIDEKILKQNKCKTCLGDILNIPLKDKSVDMVIACDILEHVEKHRIEEAVKELQRVSQKYVYIQVPHNEILRYGVAKCPICGNIWHVNFHKNSFKLNDLEKFQNDEWRITTVNYTGMIANRTENEQVYAKIEHENLPIYRVKDFKCPKCGALSDVENLGMLEDIKREFESQNDLKIISPKYTEIGVLFERNNKKIRGIPEIWNIYEDKFSSYSNNIMDFSKRIYSTTNYDSEMQIPYCIVQKNKMLKRNDGVEMRVGEEYSWFGLFFPYKWQTNRIYLTGVCNEDTTIKLISLDKEEKECLEKEYKFRKGKFECCETISAGNKEGCAYIKVYYDKPFIMEKAKLITNEEEKVQKYLFITQDMINDNHICLKNNNIIYQYYIPEEGVAVQLDRNGLLKIC